MIRELTTTCYIMRCYANKSKELGNYYVILERLHNGEAGQPRYKATIFHNINDFKYGYLVRNFTFNGSYLGEREGAIKILEHYFNKYNLDIKVIK